MKNLLIMALISLVTSNTPTIGPTQRVMTGNYYDYMVIETVDGNEWLLDDTATEDNPYMVYDPEYQEYISKFEDGELVQVLFDTMGTEDLSDDVILTVRSIGKGGVHNER